MHHSIEEKEQPLSDADKVVLTELYKEICNSYHAIDNFRMQLLSLLPLFSLVGYFFIEKGKEPPHGLFAFAGLFAALFTLGLFIYEIRGIIRCNTLFRRGQIIEEKLGMLGQFTECCNEQEKLKGHVLAWLNAKSAACLIYSLVFASWFYIFLKFTLQDDLSCILSGIGLGLIVFSLSFFYVLKSLIPT